MKIPVHIDLGAHRFEVRSDPETARLLTEEGSNGDSRADRLIIRIDPDRPPSSVAQTLLHELMHCMWAHGALKEAGFDNDQQEQIICGLAPPMLEVLRRNPALVKLLTE